LLPTRLILAALLAALSGAPVMAQPAGAGIFTCVDAKGRRLTADRPIMECIDREQKELNPSGSTRRAVGPSLTAHEQTLEEDKARRVAQEQQRIEDEKRRDRALLMRYPTREIHERERTLALQRVEDVIVAVARRSADLRAQRAELAAEADAFGKDPARQPARLTQLIQDNEQLQGAQQRFIDDQTLEKKRLGARFDDELARLQRLWNLRDAPTAAAAGVTPAGLTSTPRPVR
jgi:hypothetical protein